MASAYWNSWNGLNQHPKSAVPFFKLFMRFEYALKECGFLKPNRQKAEPDWDKFAKALGSKFFAKCVDSRVCPTFLIDPPKSQSQEGGQMAFNSMPPPTNVQELFGAVCRVRNNLFHGGKSGPPDADRDESLLREATNILLLASECANDDFYVHLSGNY